MEPWKAMTKALARSKAKNAICKKHKKHRQSPGVCSICVSEKLLRFPNYNLSLKAKAPISGSSSSSSYISSLSSSSDISSCSSPLVSYTNRIDSEARKSMRVFKNGGQNVLKKSRSMAFVLQRRKEEDIDKSKKISMKKGFWSKLLPRRNTKGLMHSRTLRERVLTAVH